MNLHHLLLPCFLILFLASCGPTQESKGGKEEGKKGDLRLEQTDDYLRVLHKDQPVLNYWLSPQLPEGIAEHYTRSGFLHPIWSPDGQMVSDGFPAGYAHQHGFFTAWTNTTFRDSFTDFWNTHKGLATVMHQELMEVQQQDGILGFKAKLTHNSKHFGPVLNEELTIRVHDRAAPFVFDVRSEQTNVTKDTLFLNKHLYGGLGIRGSRHWNPKDTANFLAPAEFLTSQGLTADSANHTRPEWTAIYGDMPQGKAGMAVIPHPDNFRWPVPVRVHPELPYFSVSPIIFEPAFIAPEEPYISRYRVVVFDGAVDGDAIKMLQWE